MTGIICNYNSICIDIDCKFEHSISLKDRKVVSKLYQNLICPNKNEDNAKNRKANCRFGQICYNQSCGFKHRLNYNDRIKLINGFNDAKLEMTRIEKAPKVIEDYSFNIPKKNLFECLEFK
jgi:hypothetical protein